MAEPWRRGHRIQTLRQAFILRDGIMPDDFRLPDRMSKTPDSGPLSSIVRDFEEPRRSFYEAMGWEGHGERAGYPLKDTLEKLDLAELIAKYGC